MWPNEGPVWLGRKLFAKRMLGWRERILRLHRPRVKPDGCVEESSHDELASISPPLDTLLHIGVGVSQGVCLPPSS